MSPFNSLIAITAASLLVVVASTGCSTTRRLAPDQKLYTGIKSLTIAAAPDEKVPSPIKAEIKRQVYVAPNGMKLLGLNISWPPVGLWAYNHLDRYTRRPGKWLYDNLAQEPVLVADDVRPELRVRMLEQELDNQGYFRNSASFQTVASKSNPQREKIAYTINLGPAYLLDSITFPPPTSPLNAAIDSAARTIAYLSAGNRYSTDSLAQARISITNALRDRGYYFFRPEYIEYLADSTITPDRIALRLTIARNAPAAAMKAYSTGSVTIRINRNQGGGTPDTLLTGRATVVVMRPSRLRAAIIPECVTFRRGRTFAVSDMNSTQTYLSRLGIFNAITIEPSIDSTALEPTLDIAVSCTFDAPYEAGIEANIASKSNSFLGPGATVSLTNRNLLGGGEQLRLALTGSYEWQTGSNRSSIFNSYEAGVNASLAFPRVIAPKFIRLSRRNLNRTRFSLNADMLNRPSHFHMAQFGGAISYEWQLRSRFNYTFSPLKITYIRMLHTTASFDSIIAANPAVGLSFRNRFMPQMTWSMTYDHTINRDNAINIRASLAEAGNVAWLLWRAAGVTGEKRLMGMPFSQFVKATAQVVYSRRIGSGDHWLVGRLLGGIAHAYGNSSEVPYSEQFYIGGANSIRAFTVRSIGPGSYRPSDRHGNNFDRTGTVKMECNLEFRFPIAGPLHGATFIDAGNVWLLHNDPARPGGQLRADSFLRDIALGSGFGLRLDISMLVVRADLGIGIHTPYPTDRHTYYNMPSFRQSLALHLAIGYPF